MSYNHISHELLIEADHDFEGYSDFERADYGKQNLSFMSEYLQKCIICEYLEADEILVLLYVSTPAPMRDSGIGMDVFAM